MDECDCKCHTWKPRVWAICLVCGNWRHPDLHDKPPKGRS